MPKAPLTAGKHENSEIETKHSHVASLSTRYTFHSTGEIIEACKNYELPDQIMFNFHPQRWTDIPFLWTQEYILQNAKNLVKRCYRIVRG